jgi:arylsulfatase A-like enzyme
MNILYVFLLMLCAFAFCGLAAEPKPNVVFILIDDMGWTDLGCMGSDLFQTPNIDKLAARGMKFTNAYAACTVCSPTRAAVMTGKYPARLHVTDWIAGHERPTAKLKIPEWTKFLPKEEQTIAAALKPHGYASASVGKWHLGKDTPEAYGFDANVAGCHMGQPPSYFAPYKIPTLKEGADGEYLTDRLTDEACGFMEQNKDKPFFLYLPHYTVHTPLQAKKELIEQYKAKVKEGMRHTNATYAAMIHSLDEGVGKIVAKLDALKLTERTIVIFTSDNGGLLRITVNDPLRAGKGSAYEGGVRVPLLVNWPGVTAAGSVCEEPIISMDYFPTILEMTGHKAELTKSDGVSIVPVLRDAKAKLPRDEIFWHYPHYHPGGATPYGAVRARDWKLIEFYEDNHVELYNLKDDIGEQNDLAAKMPEKAAELRKKLAEWRTAVGAQMPTPNPNYDPNPPKQEPKKGAKKADKKTAAAWRAAGANGDGAAWWTE